MIVVSWSWRRLVRHRSTSRCRRLADDRPGMHSVKGSRAHSVLHRRRPVRGRVPAISDSRRVVRHRSRVEMKIGAVVLAVMNGGRRDSRKVSRRSQPCGKWRRLARQRRPAAIPSGAGLLPARLEHQRRRRSPRRLIVRGLDGCTEIKGAMSNARRSSVKMRPSLRQGKCRHRRCSVSNVMRLAHSRCSASGKCSSRRRKLLRRSPCGHQCRKLRLRRHLSVKCRVLRCARNHNRRRNQPRSNNMVESAGATRGMSAAGARAG